MEKSDIYYDAHDVARAASLKAEAEAKAEGIEETTPIGAAVYKAVYPLALAAIMDKHVD